MVVILHLLSSGENESNETNERNDVAEPRLMLDGANPAADNSSSSCRFSCATI
jgi:hypothetical protein